MTFTLPTNTILKARLTAFATNDGKESCSAIKRSVRTFADIKCDGKFGRIYRDSALNGFIEDTTSFGPSESTQSLPAEQQIFPTLAGTASVCGTSIVRGEVAISGDSTVTDSNLQGLISIGSSKITGFNVVTPPGVRSQLSILGVASDGTANISISSAKLYAIHSRSGSSAPGQSINLHGSLNITEPIIQGAWNITNANVNLTDGSMNMNLSDNNVGIINTVGKITNVTVKGPTTFRSIEVGGDLQIENSQFYGSLKTSGTTIIKASAVGNAVFSKQGRALSSYIGYTNLNLSWNIDRTILNATCDTFEPTPNGQVYVKSSTGTQSCRSLVNFGYSTVDQYGSGGSLP